MIGKAFISILLLLFPILLKANSDTLFIYGPGGPMFPFQECSQIFSIQTGIPVKVVAGPEANWIDKAQLNADIIFGGAEYMLNQFSTKHPGLIDNTTRTELYKRGAAILVRPGNPKHIKKLKDLANPRMRLLDVNGAGQLGLWEDIVGKPDLINELQLNIMKSFENTALGLATWEIDPSYDAWITFESWYYRTKNITKLVKLPKALKIYRGTPVAITTISDQKLKAKQLIQFMQSNQGHNIFKKWGWE